MVNTMKSVLCVYPAVLCCLKMEDLELPEIKRKKTEDKKVEDKKEFSDLFHSDSDAEEDDGKLKIRGKLILTYTNSLKHET